MRRGLSNLASHDALTGLLNRREFEQRVRAIVEHREAYEAGQHAVLYLDLDEFKVVNDTMRSRRRRRVAAPGRRAAAAAAARRRHARAPRRRRVRRAARALPARARAARSPTRCARRSSISASQWNKRSFKIGVSIGRRQPRRRARTRCERAVGRRRRVLHGEGQGPQPRAGLPARETTKSRCAAARWNGSTACIARSPRIGFCLYAQPVHAMHGGHRGPRTTPSCCCG